MTDIERPRVKDNDLNEITVTLGDKEIRGWSYENEAERREKIGKAREFVEGWLGCETHLENRNQAGSLRLCGYCKAWNSKPCGDGCHWMPTDPTPAALSQESL